MIKPRSLLAKKLVSHYSNPSYYVNDFPTMNEFEIIRHFFANQINRPDVSLGIGDDAALVTSPANCSLAVTADTLVAGVHFPIATQAFDVGFKALAVNLSDLAAMGAAPAWVTMALTLPYADEVWLTEFCEGFFKLAAEHDVQLIGGDLTRGPLSITIQAMGFVPEGKALHRSGAKVGDLVYVTGTLGDAGLALRELGVGLDTANKSRDGIRDMSRDGVLARKLNRPEPRVAIGLGLRDMASAAIDVSDGLAADLGHILKQSKVGAKVNVDTLPLSSELQKIPQDTALTLALSSGDDYELCFTIAPENQHQLEQNWHYHDLNNQPISLTCIGVITHDQGLYLHHHDNKSYKEKVAGYEHF